MTGPLPVLSVVVPVGTVDNRFDLALEALRSQTHMQLEIILVLDGLDLAARTTVHGVAARDPRVVVVENDERLGAGNARNVGLRAATGEYVAFADADDVVPTDAYRRLLAAFAQAAPDVVSGRAEQFTSDGRETTYWTVDDALWATGGRGLRLSDTPVLAFDHTPWNKVFKRTWLLDTGVEFATRTTCEDVSWWAQLVVRATVDVVPEVVYRHRRHDASVTAGIGRGDDLSDWVVQTRAAVETYEAHGAREACAALGRRLIRREAWTRVRAIDALSPSDAQVLADFVAWIGSWAEPTEFEQLSAFPGTAYALLRQRETHLVAAFVRAFDQPADDAVERWRRLAPEVGRAIASGGDLAADLWRERMFRPVLDAAQRREVLPIRPESVVEFWEAFVGGGLDDNEQRVLSALRDGAVEDVAFLRRNRRVHPVADRRLGALRISFEGLEGSAQGRILRDRDGVTTVVHQGMLSSDTVVASSARPGDLWSVEFALSGGRRHRVEVAAAPSGITRVRNAIRARSGRLR
ncbi:glycosyl transferase family 2 [Curtobacterium sp. PhB42]|uniref:glycosyltransferase family 2 protein n=1 Tax=unclassified Curtobacterium TaxID=257496 RepID=UPI00104AE9BF|nr:MULTISPECIES: glycosyltransferase family 2 protein [unclassified Curtobacterium]TCU85928.1 glycosyl transferase family 2 [Curtobacterium sp. PhB191]TDW45685.1 glycosyl transferase family 2 [Curtobacterium sp. PhB42]TDW57827.1 glycosyl transferase family 2 [Curtobacterium sp. PhB190]